MHRARRSMPFLRERSALLIALLLASRIATGHADDARPDTGHGRSALPAVDLAPVLALSDAGLIRAHASFGYGYTEDVLNAGDAHHRTGGELALSYQLIDEVAIAGRFDARFDSHTGDDGGDEGFASQAWLIARAGVPVSASVMLGAELALRFPGTADIGRTFDAFSPELRGVATLAPPAWRTMLSGTIGFRIDRASAGVADPDGLSLHDRVGLNASDANAVLLGLAAVHSVGQLAVLGEWTWDLQVGELAADPIESPMRIAAGVRWLASRSLQLQALLGVSPSARPVITDASPLYPIEPRVFLELGVGMRFGDPPPPPPPPRVAPAPVQPAPLPPPPPAAPTTRTVNGRVIDSASQSPIAGAAIEVTGVASGTSDAAGLFKLEGMPLEFIELRVHAAGYDDAVVPVGAGAGQAADLEIELAPDRTIALIRGTVSNFQGRPVAGTVLVQPGNVGAVLDNSGSFELEVPPGEYTVLIKASGYGLQQRIVHVERGDVAVIVVQLQVER